MVSVTTGLAAVVCVSPGPVRKAIAGNSVTRHPRTVAQRESPSTATGTLSAASMTQQGQSFWHTHSGGHSVIVQAHSGCEAAGPVIHVCILGAQDCLTNAAYLLEIKVRFLLERLKLLFCSLLAFRRSCSICVPFVLILLRCICMDGYEGDGFSCQPIDLCSQPERGGCSENVSGVRLSKSGGAASVSQSRGPGLLGLLHILCTNFPCL